MGFARDFRNWALTAVGALGIGYLTLFPASAQETTVLRTNSRYAIVVKDTTFKTPEWKAVVDSLDKRHRAEVFQYKERIEEVQSGLNEYNPTDICLVGTPEDVGGPELPHGPEWAGIGDVMRAARRTVPVRFADMANKLDNDPYRDATIGIVTGYTADDALRISTTHDFAIDNALLKADEDKLSAFTSGTGYSEADNNVVVKTTMAGGKATKQHLERAGEDIVNTINTDDVGLVCTTGHGNYNQWRISYSDRVDGWLISQEGNIYLIDESDPSKAVGSIDSVTPKVIVANGNCRMGGMPNRNSIFLAWMHSGGAVQCIGYQTDTWYGGAGWAINEHMFNNHVSWSEAHEMTELGLQVRRERLLEVRGGARGVLPPTNDGDKHTLGHIYDSDVFTFYGDPGTRVTINFNPKWIPLYTKKQTTVTTDSAEKYNFSLHINKDGITKPVIFPVEEDLTTATLTTKPSDLFVKVIDNAVVLDPSWQTVTKENGQVVIRNRSIKPGDDFSAEITVTR